MKMIFMRVAVAAVASGLAGGIAVAQNPNMGEITVQGTRMVTTKVVGRTSSGIPINDVSLSYGVIIKGLDLASQAGFMEAERRVKDAAQTACKELVKRYPNGTPSEAECAKAAADKAMVVVNGWAALASKASGK
jgi:UrcA family protein